MIPFTVIATILTAHFIGDFLLQSGWMAVNKSSNWAVLTAHVMLYVGALLLVTIVVGASNQLIAWLIFNGAAHFLIDACTSRMNGAAKRAGNEKLFWVVIGADQLLHQICLFGSLILLGL